MNRQRLLGIAALTVSGAALACSAILGLDETSVVAGYTRDASASDAGCKGDLDADPRNCGACGHDCLGGACVGSKCQPTTLIDDPKYSPTALAVDDANAYLADTTTGSILRVAKNGDGGVAQLSTSEPGVFNMVAGGGYVYFSLPRGADGGPAQVSRCDTTGCNAGTRLDFANESGMHPESLAMDSTSLFYALNDTPGEIWRCALPDCSNKVLLAPIDDPWSLALNGSMVFWFGFSSGNTYRCGKDGCVSPGGRKNKENINYGMAADSTHLYFGDASGSIVRLKAADMGYDALVISNQVSPGLLLIDGPNLYWINAGTGSFKDGALLRCPKDACSGNVEVMAAGLNNAYALVQDADALYYSTRGDGRLWKLRKP